MYSLYLVFVLLTFSCIGCVHNVGVQRADYFTNHQEKYSHNENQNNASLILELNNRPFKREVSSNNETHQPVVKKDMLDNKKQSPSVSTSIDSNKNVTEGPKIDDPLKSFNSGATKRGAVVFGGLTLCALLYLTFKLYRNKQTKSEGGIAFQSTEAPKFRYGVLKSDDNMELSNLALNMETDDEEDDLQLFDLEQSKRGMSTSNLRILSDENDGKSDIEVLNLDLPLPGDIGRSDNRSHLLLDIDDEMTDPLVSLQSNSSKT